MSNDNVDPAFVWNQFLGRPDREEPVVEVVAGVRVPREPVEPHPMRDHTRFVASFLDTERPWENQISPLERRRILEWLGAQRVYSQVQILDRAHPGYEKLGQMLGGAIGPEIGKADLLKHSQSHDSDYELTTHRAETYVVKP